MRSRHVRGRRDVSIRELGALSLRIVLEFGRGGTTIINRNDLYLILVMNSRPEIVGECYSKKKRDYRVICPFS